MSRARDLAKLGNINVLSGDDISNEVGIASTVPRSTLDVRGELQVGTAIKAGPAGVLTATSFDGGTSGNVTGAACTFTTGTFNGNVTIGGTLTYEDVTNIDSLGIVTARAGVNVSGGQLQVGVAYSVGAAGVATAAGFVGPLTGAVTGNADTATEATNVTAVNNSTTNTTYRVPFLTAATGTSQLQSDNDDGMTYNPSENKLSVINVQGTLATAAQPSVTSLGTLTGLTVSGDVSIADKIVHTGDTNTAIRFSGADTVKIETAGSNRFQVNDNGKIGVGVDPTAYPGKFVVSGAAGGASGILCDREIISRIASGVANTERGFQQITDGVEKLAVYVDNGSAVRINNDNGSERVCILGTGRVGIGTSAADAKVEISDATTGGTGGTGEEVLLKLAGRTDKNVYLDINADADRRGVIRFKSAGTDKWSIGRGDSDELSDSSFMIATGSSGGNTAKLVITSGGVTQITKGTSGGATANTDAALIVDNSSHTYVQFRTPSDKEQGLLFGDVQDNNVGSITYSHSTNALSFAANANERLRILSTGRVVIGDTASDAQLGVVRDSYYLAEFTNTNADATGAELSLRKDSASPADDDSLGILNFIGDNDAGQKTTYTYIRSKSTDVTDGTEDGTLEFHTRSNGTIAERLRIASTGDLNLGATGTYNDITETGGGLLIGPGTGKNAGIVLRSDSDGFGRIYFGDNSGSAPQRHDGYIVYSQTDRNFVVGTATTTRITVGSAGQIGIAGANYGSSGQVLTSGGSGSAPSWAEAGGGATEVIQSWDFGANYGQSYFETSATGITTSSGFIAYELVISGLQFVGGEAEKLAVRVYKSGGSLESGNNYKTYCKKSQFLSASDENETANSVSTWELMGTNNQDREFWDGSIKWKNPGYTTGKTMPPFMRAEWYQQARFAHFDICQVNFGNTDYISGIRVYNNSDASVNLMSGRACLIGYKFV